MSEAQLAPRAADHHGDGVPDGDASGPDVVATAASPAPVPGPDGDAGTNRAREFRIAGRAALVGAAAWLVEPALFLQALFSPRNQDPTQTLAQWRDASALATLGGIALILMGVALAVLVQAVHRLRRGTDRAMIAASEWLGRLVAGSLVIAGSMDLTDHGFAGASLVQIPTDDEGARWLAQQSFMMVHESLRLAACLGLAAWLVVLAATGRSAGLIGLIVAITIVVAAVLIALPAAATGLLTGMNLVLLALIPLAVAFLRRARRTVRAATR